MPFAGRVPVAVPAMLSPGRMMWSRNSEGSMILGLKKCQYVAVRHSDTEYGHIHMVPAA